MIKPQSIKIFSITYIVALILGLASFSVGLTILPELLLKPSVVILYLLFTAFFFFLVYKINKAENWARITLSIFSSYGVFAQFYDPNPQNLDIPLAIKISNYSGAVLIIIGLLYLFVPSSNRWFKDTRK